MNKGICPQTAHVWSIFLPDWWDQQADFIRLLSPDEITRANRYRFDVHRGRFILSRAFLRKILSLYVSCSPQAIQLDYEEKGKPFLLPNPGDIQFNLSHSEDVAVYVITQGAPVGADVEKRQDTHPKGIAERFFSPSEVRALAALSVQEQREAFYQIWVKKEAVIKLFGTGLYSALDSFSVTPTLDQEPFVYLDQKVFIYSVEAHPAYSAAFAVHQPVQQIERWEWRQDGLYLDYKIYQAFKNG